MNLKAQGPAAYLYGSKRISDAKGEQDIPYIIGLCFTACAGEGENRGNILWESPGNGFTDYGLHHMDILSRDWWSCKTMGTTDIPRDNPRTLTRVSGCCRSRHAPVTITNCGAAFGDGLAGARRYLTVRNPPLWILLHTRCWTLCLISHLNLTGLRFLPFPPCPNWRALH